MSIRTIFFGTPQFALPTLHALHNAPEIDLVGVVTRPDRPAGRGKKLQAPPIKNAALDMGLEIYQPVSLKKPEVIDWLSKRKADVMVVVAYGGFIPTAVRDLTPMGCVNLHPSLLPKYRGAAPMQWAIMNGDAVTGNSTMYLADGWDDGDIIYQAEDPILDDDNYGTMSDRLSQKGGDLIVRSLIDIKACCAPRIVQNDDDATMAPMIKNEDAQINWNRSVQQINDHIRGITPIPGAFTIFEGKRWKVLKADILHESPEEPGTIMGTEFNTIRVSAADGIIEILELQPEGKKPMKAAAFLRGFKPEDGAACESP
jgi:methionyl-tRNA formyltransferase